MWSDILSAFLISLVLSLGLNRAMLTLAPRVGLIDQPGERRIHSAPIPRAGGIAVWLGFMIIVSVGLATGWFEIGGNLSWNWLVAFGAGSSVLMVAGVIDDRWGMRASVKLVAHLLAPAIFFLIHPLQIGLFPANWPWACDFVMFVIWSVLLINAFNLIDGLDGLCGGLALVSVLALAGLSLMNGRVDAALLLVVMGGAILGFLKYNYNPARIFLGDAGSMVIGFFLATAATDAVGRKAVLGVMLLPIAVAGVPLLDVLLAIWRRGAKRAMGQLKGDKVIGGIFDADAEHLHHRLLSSGSSQRKVAVVLQGIAILMTSLAFLPMFLGDRLLGISLVGFMIVGLVGLRNLARVEIEHTGSVIHLAIKLPGNRRRVAAAMFVHDVVVFVAAGFAAVMIETNFFQRGADLRDLVKFVIIFAVFGNVALLVVRVHRRLWVRATLRDMFSLAFWMFVAAAASFTVFSLSFHDQEWSALRLTLMSYVFACSGICVPRAALDVVRELGIVARYRNPKKSADGCGAVVVLGAGDLGALFLDHLKSSAHDLYPGINVLGFIDQSTVLYGRRLRSFPVLGGLSVVPALVRDRQLRGIVVAIKNPSLELLTELNELAACHSLKIYQWRVGLETISAEAGESGKIVEFDLKAANR